MNIVDLDECLPNGKYYGGNAGRKYGITYKKSNWLVKFPQSTKEMINPKVSYTSSPLSEYLGSHLYESLNIPVHETLLGYREHHIVVACKDFTDEKNGTFLTDFHKLKNAAWGPVEGDLTNSGTGSSSNLSDILATFDKIPELKTLPDTEKHFWTMFVVDAFIGNPDRNNENWGILTKGGNIQLAPVFDNGNSLFNKRSDASFASRTHDKNALAQDALGTNVSFYTDDLGMHLHPFDYLASTTNKILLQVIYDITQRINLKAIQEIIDAIPTDYKGLPVMSGKEKDFYKQLFALRLNDPDKGLKTAAQRAANTLR